MGPIAFTVWVLKIDILGCKKKTKKLTSFVGHLTRSDTEKSVAGDEINFGEKGGGTLVYIRKLRVGCAQNIERGEYTNREVKMTKESGVSRTD